MSPRYNGSDTHGVMRLMSLDDPQPGHIALPRVISRSVQPSPLNKQFPMYRRCCQRGIDFATTNGANLFADSWVIKVRKVRRARENDNLRDASNKGTIGGVVLTGRNDLATNDELGLGRTSVTAVEQKQSG